MGRGERSDSIVSVASLSDDFLPLVSEFLMQPPIRDRAFSWDVAFDGGLDPDSVQALLRHPIGGGRSRSGSLVSVGSFSGTGLAAPRRLSNVLLDGDIFNDDGASPKQNPLPVKKRKMMQMSDSSSSSSLVSKKMKGIGLAQHPEEEYDMEDLEGEPFEFIQDESPTASPVAVRASRARVSAAESGGTTGTGRKSGGRGRKGAAAAAGGDDHKDVPVTEKKGKGGKDKEPSSVGPSTMVPSFVKTAGESSQHPFQQAAAYRAPTMTAGGVGGMSMMSTSAFSSASSSAMPTAPPVRPSGPLYGPEPELTVATFGPMNGVIVGDGCRVGVYSREERQKRIERFREKKLKRIWRKQIKYDCRKRLADTRPRVKGRFVSRAGEGEVDENAPTGAAGNPPGSTPMLLLGMPLPGKAISVSDEAGAPHGISYSHNQHLQSHIHSHTFGETTEEDTGADSECSSSIVDPSAPQGDKEDGGQNTQNRPRRDSLACIMDLIDQNG